VDAFGSDDHREAWLTSVNGRVRQAPYDETLIVKV